MSKAGILLKLIDKHLNLSLELKLNRLVSLNLKGELGGVKRKWGENNTLHFDKPR